MSYRAVAIMRALSKNAGCRRVFYPWRLQPSHSVWAAHEAMIDETVSLSSYWRRWDPFRDFDHVLAFVEKEAENSSASQKVGHKTVGFVPDDKNFIYNFDLRDFNAENIKVKTVGQKVVVEAEAQQQEEKDSLKSFSHRQYHRSLILPTNVNPEDLTTSLTDQGVLSIKAPLLEEKSDIIERELKITKEETPAVEESVKQDSYLVSKVDIL